MIKKISIFILVFVSLFLIGCSSGENKFEKDYPAFKDTEHVFYKTSYKDIYNKLTKEEGYNIILFAFDPNLAVCPFCLEALPVINEVALELKIDKIFYLDIYEMRINRTTEYMALVNYIDEQVDDLLTRNDKLEIVVPDIYVVKDGKIIAHHIATIVDDEGKFVLGMGLEQTNELKEIYRELFTKTKS